MMKILILTEGGKEVGFGHLTRCLSLYQAFVAKEEIPEFILKGDDTVSYLLNSVRYQMFNWLTERERLLEKLRSANIVVVDSYLAEKQLYEKISEMTGGRLAVIDDYNRLGYPKGIVINPSIYGDEIDYQIREDMFYLTGGDYIILRKEFWDVPRKEIRKEVKNILVTSGGINHPGFVRKTTDHLKTKFDFDFHIIDPIKDRLNAGEMLDWMLKADICISGGGQTINELARVGVPTIGTCFYENQRLNLEAWHKEGFIEYEGWFNDDGLLDKIEYVIKKLLPYRERIKRSKIGKDKVDGKGAKRIASRLIELLT